MVLSPVHPGVPPLVVYALGTCNKFTSEFAKTQVIELVEMWNRLGYNRTIGPIDGDGSDGEGRRVILMLRIFGKHMPVHLHRYRAIVDESFTATIQMNDDDTNIVETIPFQDDLQYAC